MNVFEVIIPKLGANDDSAIISKWVFQDGNQVEKGDILAVAETTKSSFDIEAEENGYCYSLFEEGREVKAGKPIAIILPQHDEQIVSNYLMKIKGEDNSVQNQSDYEIKCTRKARVLIEEYNVDISLLPKDKIIKENDVLDLVKNDGINMKDVHRRNYIIYGASIGGEVILDYVNNLGQDVVAFIDDTKPHNSSYLGVPVWNSNKLPDLKEYNVGSVASHIADRDFRISLIDFARENNLSLPNIIHPKAIISPSARIGIGNVIKAGAIIDSHVKIGNCCIIDNGVVVAHHANIGHGSHLAPGVSMGGNCHIGNRTLINIGVSIMSHIKIGNNVIVGIASCVTNDIDDNLVVAGNPAKQIGKRSL